MALIVNPVVAPLDTDGIEWHYRGMLVCKGYSISVCTGPWCELVVHLYGSSAPSSMGSTALAGSRKTVLLMQARGTSHLDTGRQEVAPGCEATLIESEIVAVRNLKTLVVTELGHLLAVDTLGYYGGGHLVVVLVAVLGLVVPAVRVTHSPGSGSSRGCRVLGFTFADVICSSALLSI